MNKKIDISQPMNTLEGVQMNMIIDGTNDTKAITLKDILMRYIVNANSMNITDSDREPLYSAGIALATATKELILDPAQYNVIKKLCDHGKVSIQDKEINLWNFIATEQARQMVDEAENVKEK